MNLLGIIFLCCLLVEAKGSTRTKRIIHGDRVHGRKNGYKAVNYFAAFGSVHGKPWYTVGFWNLLKKHGLYGEIICGGALLSPTMVQTACHCIATFPFGYKGSYVDPALINHHWEGTMAVYVGVNHRFPTYGHEDEPSMLTIPPLETEKFFVHPKCGKLPDTSNVYVSFDVAVIRVSGNWYSGNSGVPTKDVLFAPLYSHEHLDKMFEIFLEKQTVCLTLGFGLYGDNYEYPSDAMRQGWETLVNYKDCVKSSTTDMVDEKNYTQYLSWACTRSLVKHNQSVEPGDSGGPISCDNHFFGVASSQFYEGSQLTDVCTANKYIPFISTFESREALDKLVHSSNAFSYPDEVKFFYKLKTPRPELRYKRPIEYREFQESTKPSRSPLLASDVSRSQLLASNVFLFAVILVSAILQ